MLKLFVGWLLFINLTGVIAMGTDKQKACRNQWRVPEKTLFLIAFLGGSVGCIFGMHHFHHKTRHPSFRYGLPLIFFFELGAALILHRLGISLFSA